MRLVLVSVQRFSGGAALDLRSLTSSPWRYMGCLRVDVAKVDEDGGRFPVLEISGYICRCQDDALGVALGERLPEGFKSPMLVVTRENTLKTQILFLVALLSELALAPLTDRLDD